MLKVTLWTVEDAVVTPSSRMLPRLIAERAAHSLSLRLAAWQLGDVGCDPPGFRPHRSSDLIEAVKQQIDECERLVDRVCDRDRGLALYHSGQCDVHVVGMWLDVNVRSLVCI